jgi:hypothetical protein
MNVDLSSQGNDMLWAGLHTEHASLASSCVNDDGTFHFCHILSSLRVVHIFTIETHDVVKHALCLYSGTVGIKPDGLDIAVDGFMPETLPPVFVTFPIIFFCRHL